MNISVNFNYFQTISKWTDIEMRKKKANKIDELRCKYGECKYNKLEKIRIANKVKECMKNSYFIEREKVR